MPTQADAVVSLRLPEEAVELPQFAHRGFCPALFRNERLGLFANRLLVLWGCGEVVECVCDALECRCQYERGYQSLLRVTHVGRSVDSCKIDSKHSLCGPEQRLV